MSSALHVRLAATGIGYAGLDGAWWLPASLPFELPAASRVELQTIGRALFLLSDSVAALYGRDPAVTSLLEYKVAPQLRRFHNDAPVLGFRPDFQLVPQAGGLGFCATEVEIAPSAQGFAHAMQCAYGLESDLVAAMARLLHGRTLLIVGAEQWSEFLIEQVAFCRALEEQGAQARVLYDLPFAQIAESARLGERWRPPLFGVEQRPPGWNPDLRARLEASGLLPFLWPQDEEWPETPANVLVFRFGYLETFGEEHRDQLALWQTRGVPFLNPLHFAHESKAVMAAFWLPAVQRWIGERDATALDVLYRALPHTLLLLPSLVPAVRAQRETMVVKWAGFDGGNEAWGGRSLHVGATYTDAEWATLLERLVTLPFPVVAQRLTPSQRITMRYQAADGTESTLDAGASRLRCFFVRDAQNIHACGAHVTLSNAAVRVSEGTESVQAPVRFVAGQARTLA